MGSTHIKNAKGYYFVSNTAPSDPHQGDEWFQPSTGTLFRYSGTAWLGHRYTSTSSTSSSTSTTTTSSSTTTSTSTSSSTTTTSTSTTL